MPERQSLRPGHDHVRSARQRLDFKGEVLLAALPTATVLAVFGLVEVLSQQRLLFASLASSAFLIYLDPLHGTNSIRTLVLAQMTAAGAGLATFAAIGNPYLSAGTAMILTIVVMISLDVVHPPAVSTALSFAFRTGDASNILIFALAVALTAVLVVLERWTIWAMARLAAHREPTRSSGLEP